ncbi:MAG TPA: hypothetical protein VH593_25790 [Ktedonobacteraceae bacterium]
MEITDEILHHLPFQDVYKTALLHARPLTEEDHTQRQGIIQTLEGPVIFRPGDYLACDIESDLQEEWPVTKQHLQTEYEQITEQDESGFASYRATSTRRACQIFESFTVRIEEGSILTGKSGDYLIWSRDNRVAVVDRIIFEESYQIISER